MMEATLCSEVFSLPALCSFPIDLF
jgi:hypothetical protein